MAKSNANQSWKRLPWLAIAASFTHIFLVPLVYAYSAWRPLWWEGAFSLKDYLVFLWPSPQTPPESYRALWFILDKETMLLFRWAVTGSLAARENLLVAFVVLAIIAGLGIAQHYMRNRVAEAICDSLLVAFLAFCLFASVAVLHAASKMNISPP
jgi:hypothetical protein